ncbi:MAG: lytic transglycosylase domain-containing protein [Chlorobia bacterium]|nr:lytic transglycosylase domain-containing protein [Fimbriimonadaceae bacterium]
MVDHPEGGMSTLRPLGPQAMFARMEEMRAQVEPPTSTIPFQISAGSSLSGQITSEGSFEPVNPMAYGANISGGIAPANLKPLIERAAIENGIETELLDALVQAESNYDPGAVSNKRAVGLTQLMPDTARGLGVTNPFDPVQNLRGGAKYLSQMLKQFDGDQTKAIAAYNAGPGAVARHGGVPPYRETQNYVDKVLTLYKAKKAG